MNASYEASLGIPELDERFARVFGHFNAVKKAQTEEGSWNDIHFELATLNRDLEICFSVEEALMRIHDCPGADEHRREHIELLDSVHALERASLTTGLTEKMVGASYAATMAHHLTQDRRHVDCLTRRKLVVVRSEEHTSELQSH